MNHPVFGKAIEWIKGVPADIQLEEVREIRAIIQQCFGLTEIELTQALAGVTVPPVERGKSALAIESDLWNLIPTTGYLRDYCTYTSHAEAPLVYHLFCALSAVGAVSGRRTYLDMTFFRIYPAMGVILLGPSGLNKTTASDIVVDILRESELTSVYSEKITPEALTQSVGKNPCGLIYAPELTAFLGRQKYMEGIIPLLTRLLDHPNFLPWETIGRGVVTLRDVGVSVLGCSTPDWFIENTPEDTFGGGYVARHLLIMQDATPRCEPVPSVPGPQLRIELLGHLNNIFFLEGEVRFSSCTLNAYEDWYRSNKEVWRHPEIETMATFYKRKPTHVLRTALCVHLAQCGDLELCENCFNFSVHLIDWTEQFLMPMYRTLFKSASGKDQDFVIKQLRLAGGVIEHSRLLRRCQYKMNARQLKLVIDSLKEAQQVQERKDRIQHAYILTE